MGGFALAFFGILIGFIFGVFRRVPHQRTVSGEIVRLEHKPDTDNSRPSYAAIVNYQVDGAGYTVRSSYRAASFRTGDRLAVCYDELDPTRAFVRPKPILYLAAYGMLIAGLAIGIKLVFF